MSDEFQLTAPPELLCWLLWATSYPRLIHVIQARGYIVCYIILGRNFTVRAFPIMHGPRTADGVVGWDDIDDVELPRWGSA